MDLPPVKLKKRGVCFVQNAENAVKESEASREAKFELLRLCLETRSPSAEDSADAAFLSRRDFFSATGANGEFDAAHRRLEDVFALANVLGLTKGSDRVTIEAMLGRAALQYGDAPAAARAADAVARSGLGSAWGFVSEYVAFALDAFFETEETVEPGANPERRASASNRLDRLGAFLAFALAHAPAEAKPALLKRWQDL